MEKQKDDMLREEEIRPEHLKAGQAPFMDADIKGLLTHKDRFVLVACPACGEHSFRKIFEKYGLQYVKCSSCGTVYINPRPTPEMLDIYYSTSKNYEYWNQYIFPASESARREKIFKPRAQRLIEFCKRYEVRPDLLLEVGAGFGTFCEEVKSAEFFRRIIAIEPTPDLAETCRKKGIDVIAKPVETIDFKDLKADVIASFEVIEHLFCPADFIRSCASLLSRGGLLVLTCPNVNGFEAETLGKLSSTFDNEHLNYFHPESLAGLIEKSGFETLEVSTPGRLDAELVRKAVLEGKCDLSGQPFLKRVLIEDWDKAGEKFQRFLAENMLSSHMWIVGRKIR